MSYLASVNRTMSDELATLPDMVLFGENIDVGSHISGLTRNLKVSGSGRIVNVGDCEATHCGLGFGLMLRGVSSVLFAKQLDFMLLGMDQFVNTLSFIRAATALDAAGSFTVVTVVYDQGLQGPQSSFNALGDMCSMARVPGYCINTVADAVEVSRQFAKPGFRFVTLSQRLCSVEPIDLDVIRATDDAAVLQYAGGDDLTVVCTNFAVPYGAELRRMVAERGGSAAVFCVNQVYPADWSWIADSVRQTGRVVYVDDSKSANLLSPTIAMSCHGATGARSAIVRRGRIEYWLNSDDMNIDFEAVLGEVGL